MKLKTKIELSEKEITIILTNYFNDVKLPDNVVVNSIDYHSKLEYHDRPMATGTPVFDKIVVNCDIS